MSPTINMFSPSLGSTQMHKIGEWQARWAAVANVDLTILGPGAVRLDGRGDNGRWCSQACHLGHGITAGMADIEAQAEVTVSCAGSGMISIHLIVAGQLEFYDSDTRSGPLAISAGQALIRVSDRLQVDTVRLVAGRHLRLFQMACDPDQLAEDFRIPGGGAALRLACVTPDIIDLNFSVRKVLGELMEIELDRPFGMARFEARVLEVFSLLLAPKLQQWCSAPPPAPSERAHQQIYDARALLDLHFDAPPTIAALAAKVALNQSKLMKGFKQLFGQTIAEYCLRLRMERARELLLHEESNVAQCGYRVGYQHHSSFTAAFTSYFGVTPSAMLQSARCHAAGAPL